MDLPFALQLKRFYEQLDVDLFNSGQNKSPSRSSDVLSGRLSKLRISLQKTASDQTYCF